MDDATLWKLGITVFGVVATLGVTLIGIVINRLYKSIDLLFEKVAQAEADRRADQAHFGRQIGVLKLAAMRNDPEGTALFEALSKNGDH